MAFIYTAIFFVLAVILTSTAAADEKNQPGKVDMHIFPGGGYGGGYPGVGYPGVGYPGYGYPGIGYPGGGYPGAGYQSFGYPGVGYPGVGNPYYRPPVAVGVPSYPGGPIVFYNKDNKKPEKH